MNHWDVGQTIMLPGLRTLISYNLYYFLSIIECIPLLIFFWFVSMTNDDRSTQATARRFGWTFPTPSAHSLLHPWDHFMNKLTVRSITTNYTHFRRLGSMPPWFSIQGIVVRYTQQRYISVMTVRLKIVMRIVYINNKCTTLEINLVP